MSKILFINSSPNRGGNTARLATALLEGKDYETLNLTDYKIYGYGQHFPDDQFAEVIAKIKAADILILEILFFRCYNDYVIISFLRELC